MERAPASLSFLFRSSGSVDAGLTGFLKDFSKYSGADVYFYAEASGRKPVFSGEILNLIRSAGFRTGLALPFTIKENDHLNLSQIVKINGFIPDILLHRTPASWQQLSRDTEIQGVSDYSWNIANEHTAVYMKKKGIKRLTWALELPVESQMNLIAATVPDIWEVTLYSYTQGFYSDYCLFAAYLGDASGPADCREECLTHSLQLKDRKGALHTVTADLFCRNSVLLESPLDRTKSAGAYYESGIRHFRFEFSEETPDRIRSITEQTLF